MHSRDKCVAYNCKNRRGDKDLTFHRFPHHDPKRLKKWVQLTRWKNWTPSKRSLLCSAHFEEQYFYRRNVTGRKEIKHNAVPTIFDFPKHLQKKELKQRKKRFTLFPDEELPSDEPPLQSAGPIQESALGGPVQAQPFKLSKEEAKFTELVLARLAKRTHTKPTEVVGDPYYSLRWTASHPVHFHDHYCLPQSIRWAEEDVQDDSEVTCENLENQSKLSHLRSLVVEVKEKWEWVGMDLKGPLPETRNGHKFVLILMDYYSKWVEAFPMRTRGTEAVALTVCNVVARLGFPLGILSRLRNAFIREVNSALSNLLKMKEGSLVFCHPQAGLLDPVTKSLVDRMMQALVRDHSDSWDVYLPISVFRLCCREHPSTRHRPLSLLHCKEPSLSTTPREMPFSEEDLSKRIFMILEARNSLVIHQKDKEVSGRKQDESLSMRKPADVLVCHLCSQRKPHAQVAELERSENGLRYICTSCQSEREAQLTEEERESLHNTKHTQTDFCGAAQNCLRSRRLFTRIPAIRLQDLKHAKI